MLNFTKAKPLSPLLTGGLAEGLGMRLVIIIIIGASLSEPHTSESNGGIFIYISVVRIPYVCLDCNLTQPHAACGE